MNTPGAGEYMRRVSLITCPKNGRRARSEKSGTRPCSAASISRVAFSATSGWDASTQPAQVRPDAVVSWPAMKVVISWSRTCVSDIRLASPSLSVAVSSMPSKSSRFSPLARRALICDQISSSSSFLAWRFARLAGSGSQSGNDTGWNISRYAVWLSTRTACSMPAVSAGVVALNMVRRMTFIASMFIACSKSIGSPPGNCSSTPLADSVIWRA